MIGTGILKGMAVTARNFVGRYFEKDRLITVQFPEERTPLPQNYRNFPFLIYIRDSESSYSERCSHGSASRFGKVFSGDGQPIGLWLQQGAGRVRIPANRPATER